MPQVKIHPYFESEIFKRVVLLTYSFLGNKAENEYIIKERWKYGTCTQYKKNVDFLFFSVFYS